MLFARCILVLIAIATLAYNCWYWNSDQTFLRMSDREGINGFALSISLLALAMTISAIAILLFTFFQVEEKNGKMMLTQRTWKIFGWMPGLAKESGKISICEAYWTFFLFVSVCSMMVAMLCGALYNIFTGNVSPVKLPPWSALIYFVPVAVLFVIALFVFPHPEKDEKKSRLFWMIALSSLFFGLLFSFYVIWAIQTSGSLMGIFSAKLIEEASFALAALLAVLIFLVILGSLIGLLVYLPFILFKFMKRTALGKILQNIKNGTCPLIHPSE